MGARIIFIAVVCLFGVRSIVARASEDHLVRPYEDRDWGVPGYASFLQKKLFLTRATYGRILVLPSAGSLGEYSLSLYVSSRAGLVSVTYVRASRNVWSYLSDKSSPSSGKGVHEAWEDAPLRFTRSDATLPIAAAAPLRGALAAMLRRTNGRWPGGTRVIVDGYDMQFSLTDGGKTMAGVITAGLSGKNVSELQKIVELLKTYCETSPSNQASLATQIERKAKQIAAHANET